MISRTCRTWPAWLLAVWLAPGHAAVEFRVADAPDGLVDNLAARTPLTDEACDAPAWRVQRLFRRLGGDLQSSPRSRRGVIAAP